MRAAAEIYKGIEFVRIFSLPDEQKVVIWQTLSRDKIIKILKDNALLSDCVQYHDYISWYTEVFKSEMPSEVIVPIRAQAAAVLSPVFK